MGFIVVFIICTCGNALKVEIITNEQVHTTRKLSKIQISFTRHYRKFLETSLKESINLLNPTVNIFNFKKIFTVQ